MNEIIDLGIGQVAIAYIFVLIVVAIVKIKKINREKEIIISSVRMTLQLVLTGYILIYVFQNPSPLITVGIIFLMEIFAIYTIFKKFKGKLSDSLKRIIAISMSIGTLSCLIYFLFIVVRITPWYSPQYFVPIAGMLIGNSMTGISLGVKSLTEGMSTQKSLIEEALILGATPQVASRNIINSTFDAAIMPTTNSMVGMGIVFLPGMMTGQILSGTSPTTAIGYGVPFDIWRGKDIIQTGILIAMYTWDAIVKGAHAVVTWVQVAATGALTGAQWLLNAAFLASPIGWIVLGVGALIAVFTLLWKNNEGFRNFFIGMWEGIKSAVVSAGGIIKGVINGICSAINILIKGYVGGINGLINGVNGVSGALGIPAIPNLPVPQIPMLASGGLIQRAGSVIVGERGAEILSLPRGASVTPLDKAGGKTENHINININGSNLTVDAIVGEIVPRLKLALANM